MTRLKRLDKVDQTTADLSASGSLRSLYKIWLMIRRADIIERVNNNWSWLNVVAASRKANHS